MRRVRVLLVCVGAAAFFAAAAHSSTATSPQATWRKKCIAKFHFCADFPYVNGSEYAFEYNKFDSGTSISGKLDSYTSNVYRNKQGTELCRKAFGAGCGYNEVYFVEVIKSKYADPWTALTALNDGVKDPRRITVHGNLAARFKGLYGPVGLSIYHDGLVYYLEAGVLGPGRTNLEPLFGQRFLKSISFK